MCVGGGGGINELERNGALVPEHSFLLPSVAGGLELRDAIIVMGNFCIVLFSGVHKLTGLYNILQHTLRSSISCSVVPSLVNSSQQSVYDTKEFYACSFCFCRFMT